MELGIGIGWRPEIADTVERLPGVDWVEVVAENVCPGHLPGSLSRLRARGTRIVPHGVSLGLGGADRPDEHRLTALAERAEALGAPLVTEHIAFVRAGGALTATPALEAGHLLPVPRTRDALKVLCENVRIAQDSLPVPLALENIAALISWPDEELTEGQFLAELVERTGVRLLIDVANLHTNHVNLGQDPVRELELLPVEAIAYVHVAGGVERDGVWHDTHAHPVPRKVLDILAELRSRTAPPGVLLERDDAFPPEEELAAELTAIRTALARGAREARSRSADAEPAGAVATPGAAAPHDESPTAADPGAVAARRRPLGARARPAPAAEPGRASEQGPGGPGGAMYARAVDTGLPDTPEPAADRQPCHATSTRATDTEPTGTPGPTHNQPHGTTGTRTPDTDLPHAPEAADPQPADATSTQTTDTEPTGTPGPTHNQPRGTTGTRTPDTDLPHAPEATDPQPADAELTGVPGSAADLPRPVGPAGRAVRRPARPRVEQRGKGTTAEDGRGGAAGAAVGGPVRRAARAAAVKTAAAGTPARTAGETDAADDGARVRLGIGQAAVLSALVAGTPAPEGFDSRRMRVQSRALSAKRADVVAKVAPELPEILGGGYRDAFLDYARNRPMRSGYRRDALDFAAHLLGSGRVTDVRVRRRLTLWHDERAASRPPLRATRFVRAARAALTIR
nr:DUF692 family multinuclear iron-containing protein [Streptomyces sp. PR69]